MARGFSGRTRVSGEGLRGLLSKHGLHLRRELGQNFIVESQIAERLAERSGIEAGDCVIEVGTGLGMLTRALAKRAKFVLTFEIDSGLARVVEEEGLLPENVRLVHADVLKQDLGALIRELKEEQGGPIRFVANLPFSSATPLMRRLLDHRDELVDWSVMLQLEVADRLFAPVGSRDYGSLAVLHHLCTELEGRIILGAGSFFPVPRVDSAFVCVRANSEYDLADGELRSVERVVRAAFGKRRKTLQNALRGGGFGLERDELLALFERLGIDSKARAETVSPELFLALSRALAKALSPGSAHATE
jgi:16S rRNA (adenine1518-N6/adenine1519-N6)-dimethyltransferase